MKWQTVKSEGNGNASERKETTHEKRRHKTKRGRIICSGVNGTGWSVAGFARVCALCVKPLFSSHRHSNKFSVRPDSSPWREASFRCGRHYNIHLMYI